MPKAPRPPPADEVIDTSGDLTETARFLYEVFQAPRFRDPRYLEWFYRKNPAGAAIETDLRDSGGRMGHIGGIPGHYHSRAGLLRTTFPLNVAVAERARGKGALGRVTTRHWEQSFERFEDAIALGMANANSVHYYEKHDGYRVVCQMPVTVCLPLWPDLSRVSSARATPEHLAGPAFEDLYGSLDLEPTEGWSARWNLDQLRWRLSQPDANYALHWNEKVVVVSRLDHRAGVPFTIVMKTFRRKAAHGSRPSINGAVAAACRFRRSPAAVYAGFSAYTSVRGVPLPERFKPAPLHLCVKSLRKGFFEPSTFMYDVFEFLDFDVY